MNAPSANKPLAERHRDELRASGLSAETIAASGIYSAGAAEIKRVLGWSANGRDCGGGMVIPFRFPDEAEAAYKRVKLDMPRRDDKGKPIKYESPKGSKNRAFFPPGYHDLAGARGIAITEGEKKALAVLQAGFPCIGITGVWNWMQGRPRSNSGKPYGQRRLIPDLSAIDWHGRSVVIIFDSDVVTNDAVQLAEVRLAEALTNAGATVRVARLPAEGDAKVGVDDFLVACGDAGPDKLQAVINAAIAPKLPPKNGPMDWARLLVEDCYTDPTGLTLQWWREQFWRWDGRRYSTIGNAELAAITLGWLDRNNAKPTPKQAADVVKCLASLCRVPASLEQPMFLDGRSTSAESIIAFDNGLLDISNIGGAIEIHSHSANWFTPSALPYGFDPDAKCPRWEGFLSEVFDGDGERIELLARFFGLCLTLDTSFQKMLVLVGPRRSGKGTILRALQNIIGPDACVSPSLGSLQDSFGLWQFIGKAVAMLPDAHLSRRTDSMRILEVLKSIVGEDSLSINRKGLPYLPNVRLKARIVITLNEMPRFNDSSGALLSRMLILPFHRSFADKMDRSLEGRLKAESPGILNWSLRALFRLQEAGEFNTPAESQSIANDFKRLSGPINGFVEDCCDVGPNHRIDCGALYDAWRTWTQDNGHEPGSRATFGEHLRAADASIVRRRRGPADGRGYFYEGITLNAQAEAGNS
jgi:putative DNA primase/helicase